MRPRHSVALEVERQAASRTWFTTTDVARALTLTDEGVRYLVRDDQLACTVTRSRRRLFRADDVLRLAAARDRARLLGVRVLRPKKIGVRGGPRQLSLFGLRKVK